MSECNSIECKSVKENYYQKNKDAILNRAKGYYKNDKERLKDNTEIRNAIQKYRNLSKKEKMKRGNMEETDIVIYLEKRNKN